MGAHPRHSRGFTLVELVIVIAITGILGAMVAVFLRTPLESYQSSVRRAELADIAQAATARMQRELRLSLPNSVRVTESGGKTYLEFLLTRSGGRYRAEGGGDILDFTASDTSFDVLGPPIEAQAGDSVVIYNLNLPGADAYAGDNRSIYAGASGSVSNIAFAAKQFPLASPSNRFQIVSGPVTYVCDATAGTITRYAGYAIQAAQPADTAAAPLSGASSALLAHRVSGCAFDYEPGSSERAALASTSLRIARDGETMALYATTHVDNTP